MAIENKNDRVLLEIGVVYNSTTNIYDDTVRHSKKTHFEYIYYNLSLCNIIS